MSDSAIPVMDPAPGARLLRFVGDRIRFSIRAAASPNTWQARLRTDIGRAGRRRAAIIAARGNDHGFADAAWRDVPMRFEHGQWVAELPLTEVGWFRAKPYLVDRAGRQRWADGGDVGISVHPDAYRTGNTIYCAFTRMFGLSRTATTTREPVRDALLSALERQGYAAIPPSGTLRDLTRVLPHITDRLGCRILHLLPVGPVPTTYARFGRYGSPYAQQDLTAIDPALVEFDKRTTAVDQFRELTAAAHHRQCRVFLDLSLIHI
jgi:starch synthase (maltosyl-transferring)